MSDTADYLSQEAISTQVLQLPRVHVEIGVLSDCGKTRSNNEDHFLAVEFGRFLNCLRSNLPAEGEPRFKQTGYGFFVADGMGGESAGEVASRLAIETLLELVLATPDWILSREAPHDAVVQERMAQRIREASATLVAEGS